MTDEDDTSVCRSSRNVESKLEEKRGFASVKKNSECERQSKERIDFKGKSVGRKIRGNWAGEESKVIPPAIHVAGAQLRREKSLRHF